MDTETLSESIKEAENEPVEEVGEETLEVKSTHTTESDEVAVEHIFEAKIRRETTAKRRKAGIFVMRGAGAISMCVSVVILAFVLMLCLFVPDFDVTLLAKLAPIAAILTAAELLFAYTKCKNGVRVNVICVAVSAAVMAACLAGGIIVGTSYEVEEKTSVERRLEGELYNACYSELKYVDAISKMKIKIELNSFSPQTEYTLGEIKTGDAVQVGVEYRSFSGSKTRFAEQCQTIIEVYRELNVPVSAFMFSCEDEFSRLSLSVEGKYQQDYTVSELAAMTHEIVAIDRNYFDDIETDHVSSEATQDVTIDETFEFNIG